MDTKLADAVRVALPDLKVYPFEKDHADALQRALDEFDAEQTKYPTRLTDEKLREVFGEELNNLMNVAIDQRQEFWIQAATEKSMRRIADYADHLRGLLIALTTNDFVNLGDLVYQVREREGQGWTGPAVTAWGEAVAAVYTELQKPFEMADPNARSNCRCALSNKPQQCMTSRGVELCASPGVCTCPDMPRCPVCNYTEHDAAILMDHGKCTGVIPTK